MELGAFTPIGLPTARALGGVERAQWQRRGPLQPRAPRDGLLLLGARGCCLQRAGTCLGARAMIQGLQGGWCRGWSERECKDLGRASSRAALAARRRSRLIRRAVERCRCAACVLASTVWAAQHRSARGFRLRHAGPASWSGAGDAELVAGAWVERCTAARPVASRVVVATTCRAVISCLGESCAHLLVNQRLGEAVVCLCSTHAEPQLHVGVWKASINPRAMFVEISTNISD